MLDYLHNTEGDKKMKLIKRIKNHTTKEGNSFKKTHFYLVEEMNGKTLEFEVVPVTFKDKEGNYNKYALQLAHMFAIKE